MRNSLTFASASPGSALPLLTSHPGDSRVGAEEALILFKTSWTVFLEISALEAESPIL